jgi:hypothetical protein
MQQQQSTTYADIAEVRAVTGAAVCNQLLADGRVDNWRRLVTRYNWYTQSQVAFLTIACFMVALPRIFD